MSEQTAVKQIALVGHCGLDGFTLKRALGRIAGRTPITTANDAAELERVATPDSLLLVNRVLGPGFGTDSGIDLIRSLSARGEPPKMMLVSNYEAAQAQATEAGALPGFGKSDLDTAAMRQRIQQALGVPATAEHR